MRGIYDMDKYNAIDKTQYIKERYKNYLRTIFKFGDEKLQLLYEKKLSEEDLFKGPYVGLEMPFIRGKNINELIDEGVICPSFKELSQIDFQRPLYAHQEKAIRHIGAGNGAIVTTGTGSGKTESFLYPILNEILQDIKQGNVKDGIRAMFLYPMNALINDQIDRLREILRGCSGITFGFFTGDTQEDITPSERLKLEEVNQIKIPPNEMLSRKEMRETPPHILFTNYSMLEYMLIRPNDYKIFATENLDNWKYVVLDEAHTYSGAQGIEMAFLLRRVTGFSLSKPKFILTSATLGEKGKSDKQIVEFANKLTGCVFSTKDIIFADRYSFEKGSLYYTVDGKDYINILESLSKYKKIATALLEKYNLPQTGNVKNILYELLIHDNNTYRLYEMLSHGAKDFKDIWIEYDNKLTEKEIVSLIELVNLAEAKNGRGVFDLKYHSFVRPLSGAYISMEKERKLTLHKASSIGKYKAFEVGNCNYCGTLYLIGKIKYDDTNNFDVLLQNEEVDIYENYGNDRFVQLDYFLLENDVRENVIEAEEVEEQSLEKYNICSRCGACKPSDSVTKNICDCGREFLFAAYRINQNRVRADTESYNNLTRCPVCGQQHNDGVVKSFNLGKDKGTATIAQFLFESLDDSNNNEVKEIPKFSLFKPSKTHTNIQGDKVKQFLSFSDSRQQASFAATYFDGIMQKSLYRRLIWQVIENNDYADLSFDAVLAELTDLIKNNDLFQYEYSGKNLGPQKNAWIALLGDLLKRDGQWDSEGLGLYFFDFDISPHIMNYLAEESDALKKYNLTIESFIALVQVVLESFKTAPAIEYVKSNLTDEEKIEYLEYKGFEKYIRYKSPKSERGIKSFMPIKKGSGNRAIRYVQKACGLDYDTADELLNVIFHNLLLNGSKDYIKKKGIDDVYRIKASSYIIKNFKNHKYYQCQKCHRLTPYNVNNACVKDRCSGVLKEINPDEVLRDNFYRNEYKNKKIEKIIIREHTAQLDKRQAKIYQRDFKNKKINILSCSTTFEMGIDLGDLDTVYMRNVPPSPANYVQRAGRAGRRKDKSAYVLTYCGIDSHDYTYFSSPEKMISGVIEPPYFDIGNKKIMSRHLLAASLGFFFKEYPYYFNFREMFFNEGAEVFFEYMQEKHSNLCEYIDKHIIPDKVFDDEHGLKWYDRTNNKLSVCIETIRENVKEYKKLQQEASDHEQYEDAKRYKGQIERIEKTNLLNILSSNSVIPKYGFPVDVVGLEVYDDGLKNDNLDLKRDLKLAISEYAPESEIIVNGKKYTSGYITVPFGHPLPKYFYIECPNCKRKNMMLGNNITKQCKYCGQDISASRTQSFIVPQSGFKTGKTVSSTRKKPRKTYASEVSYVGGGKFNEYPIVDGLCVSTSSDDELVVMNRSMFKMCPICGYAKKDGYKVRIGKHENYYQHRCICKESENVRIGHVFRTDVATFHIQALSSLEENAYDKALSFLYAFLEGISISLSINRNDIDGLVEPNFRQQIYDVLIYDAVPGGAGYVKRLLDKNAIKSSLNIALEKVSHNCCAEDTSCYNCLRNYYNQKFHSRLKRKYAYEVLKNVLFELEKV